MAIYTMDRQIYQYLTDDGTADGSPDMAVNGAITNAEFFIRPPAGELWHIARMIFHIEDDTGKNLYPENFGDLSALTNGCLFEGKRDGTTILNFSPGLPIKSHSHLGRFSFDVSYTAGAVGGNAPANGVVQDRFTFERGGQPVRLSGDLLETLSITVRDNLSTLVEFTAQCQGQKVVVA